MIIYINKLSPDPDEKTSLSQGDIPNDTSRLRSWGDPGS